MFMFKHKHTMVVKTITVTEEAYNALRRMKKEDQSFSEIIIEVSKEKSNSLDKFFGILKDSSAELDLMRKKVEEGRKRADKDTREKIKKLRKQLYGNS